MDEGAPAPTRRELLGVAGTGAAGALAGCYERFWSQADPTGPDQVDLTIKYVPADEDPHAGEIASQLRENYETVGIDATPETVSEAELYRDVLLENEYDVFLLRHPGLDEFDALYGLLHHDFYSEEGWQNPFNYSEITVAELLEDQRTTDDDREAVLVDLFEHLLQTTPYTVVAYSDAVSGVHDRLDMASPPRRHGDYRSLLSTAGRDRGDEPIEIGVYGHRPGEGFNPVAVDRNRIDGLLDLLYDPLARRVDGEWVAWLASSVEWSDAGPPRATVTIREGLEWHDGRSLDVDDVAFTFEFLADTSLGDGDDPLPAPRFRGRVSLIDWTDTDGSRTIDIVFDGANRTTARRALSIPILPEHVWRERSSLVGGGRTEALAVDNDDPVGSGLFRFVDVTAGDRIELEPFDDHAFRTAADPPVDLEGFFDADGLHYVSNPNPGAMVDALSEGDIDLTSQQLTGDHVATVREADDASTVRRPTDAFYVIGYNGDHPALGNALFRRACSRLIDREHAARELLDGFARPPSSVPELFGIAESSFEDAFEADDQPLSFPGEDGELDQSRARELFRDIGYRYEDDSLLE